MPRRVLIYPYNSSSQSVAALRAAMPELRIIRRVRSRYSPRPDDLVINWGCTRLPWMMPVWNHPEMVRLASNKASAFAAFKEAGINCPHYTTDPERARSWLAEGHRVVGRTSFGGTQGRNIVLRFPEDGVADFSGEVLWTKYWKKQREFRIHVIKGICMAESEKKRKRGLDADKYIRSNRHGWVFARGHLQDNPVPPECKAAAIGAIEALGLDFGGVDVGWHSGRVCVFEVNTAPGLEGSTLTPYINKFREYADDVA